MKQRVPVSEIRIIDPARETRVALAFAFLYIAASWVTGLVMRAWPHPLMGAQHLTSDATYKLGFKIGLLLVVPALAIRRAGYRKEDLLLGWRPTPRSVLVLAGAFVLGAALNASYLGPIRRALGDISAAEGALRVTVGAAVVLLGAGIPEEVVYRWGLQTRLERAWGRLPAIVVSSLLFTAWHIPPRYFLARDAEGAAGDLGSVLVGTGLPVFLVSLVFAVAWDRWRNLPALVAAHWGIDALPSIGSFLRVGFFGH